MKQKQWIRGWSKRYFTQFFLQLPERFKIDPLNIKFHLFLNYSVFRVVHQSIRHTAINYKNFLIVQFQKHFKQSFKQIKWADKRTLTSIETLFNIITFKMDFLVIIVELLQIFNKTLLLQESLWLKLIGQF